MKSAAIFFTWHKDCCFCIIMYACSVKNNRKPQVQHFIFAEGIILVVLNFLPAQTNGKWAGVAVVILHVSLLWQADAEISLVRVRSPFLLIEIESLSSLRSNRHLSYKLKTRKTRRLPWRCNKVACDTSTWWQAVSPTSRFANPWTSYVVALGGKTSAALVCPSFSQPWYKKGRYMSI